MCAPTLVLPIVRLDGGRALISHAVSPCLLRSTQVRFEDVTRTLSSMTGLEVLVPDHPELLQRWLNAPTPTARKGT
eukprot:15022982-Alexandrium_andersonii.AAC.1